MDSLILHPWTRTAIDIRITFLTFHTCMQWTMITSTFHFLIHFLQYPPNQPIPTSFFILIFFFSLFFYNSLNPVREAPVWVVKGLSIGAQVLLVRTLSKTVMLSTSSFLLLVVFHLAMRTAECFSYLCWDCVSLDLV